MAARQANTFLNRSPIFTSTGILAGSYSRRDLRLGAKFALLLGGRGNEILELLKAQYDSTADMFGAGLCSNDYLRLQKCIFFLWQTTYL